MKRLLFALIVPIGISVGAAAAPPPAAHPAPRPASPTMIYAHCDVRTGFCDDRPPHPGPMPAPRRWYAAPIRQVRV